MTNAQMLVSTGLETIVSLFYSYTCTLTTLTEDGVPYTVSIFAENSAGNGTKCNVTDFTNELGMFYYCTHQCILSG